MIIIILLFLTYIKLLVLSHGPSTQVSCVWLKQRKFLEHPMRCNSPSTNNYKIVSLLSLLFFIGEKKCVPNGSWNDSGFILTSCVVSTARGLAFERLQSLAGGAVDPAEVDALAHATSYLSPCFHDRGIKPAMRLKGLRIERLPRITATSETRSIEKHCPHGSADENADIHHGDCDR